MSDILGPTKMYSVYCPPSNWIAYSSGCEKSYVARKPLSTNDAAIVPAGYAWW